MSTNASYSAKLAAKYLVGTKIIDTIVSDDEQFFGFIVEERDGTTQKVWVDRDAEGNGCGHLSYE